MSTNINKPEELTEEQFRNLVANCAAWIRMAKAMKLAVEVDDPKLLDDFSRPLFKPYADLLELLKQLEAAISVTAKYEELEPIMNDVIDAYKSAMRSYLRLGQILSGRVNKYLIERKDEQTEAND